MKRDVSLCGPLSLTSPPLTSLSSLYPGKQNAYKKMWVRRGLPGLLGIFVYQAGWQQGLYFSLFQMCIIDLY